MDLTSFVHTLNSGLSKPQQTVHGFAYKVNSVLSGVDRLTGFVNGYTNPLGKPKSNAASGAGGRNVLEAMSMREDPITSIDWVGMVMDRGTESINWSYIDAIQTPSLTVSPAPVFRAGTEKHYAGPISVDSLTLTLYTDGGGGSSEGGQSLKFASSWISAIYDYETGNFGKPIDYKKTIFVYMLDATRKTVCLFKFFGCFPTSWAGYGLEGGSPTHLPTTMTISVDSMSVDSEAGSVGSSIDQAAVATGGFPIIGKLPKIPDFGSLPTLPSFPSIKF